MLILCDSINNRLKYAVKLMLDDLEIQPEFTISDSEFNEFSGPKFVYSKRENLIENAIQIHSFGLLEHLDFSRLKTDWSTYKEIDVLFPRQFGTFPFDVLAAGFFLVTRYEEYWRHEGDHMGRYLPSNSTTGQKNLLKLPLVDIWRKLFCDHLIAHFPQLIRKNHKFQFLSTIDIDSAYAFSHKGFYRTLGGVLKDLTKFNFKNLSQRIKVVRNPSLDPYDTYDYIDRIHQEYEQPLQYFFLLADFGDYDRGLPFNSKGLQSLIKRLAKKHTIGIHPGVASYKRYNTLLKEKSRLETILGKQIKSSRQHYLMLKFRATYRLLKATGIEDDYTLGYAQEIGFRAGTCRPFNWFDLKKNEESTLTIHPFAYMDATLNYYLELSPESAIREIEKLITIVHQYQGEFISIWHNETLTDTGKWKDWRQVLEYTLKRAKELKH